MLLQSPENVERGGAADYSGKEKRRGKMGIVVLGIVGIIIWFWAAGKG